MRDALGGGAAVFPTDGPSGDIPSDVPQRVALVVRPECEAVVGSGGCAFTVDQSRRWMCCSSDCCQTEPPRASLLLLLPIFLVLALLELV